MVITHVMLNWLKNKYKLSDKISFNFIREIKIALIIKETLLLGKRQCEFVD